MLRMIAVLFGIAFIFAGVAGFLPNTFMQNGFLFGYFEVSTIHNLFHLVIGVLAIMAATNLRYTILFFKLLGLIFILLAILGFWNRGDLYLIHVNMSDKILLIILGVVALYLGFFAKKFHA